MNLGTVHPCSRLRRGWTRQLSATGFAVVVGVFGLVGVHPAQGRVDAAPAAGAEGPVLDLPVPPRLLDTSEPAEPTTTTTVPVETTTTTAPPPVETTTTTAPPAPPASGPLRPPPPPAPAKPQVASVITGATRADQVRANAAAASWTPTQEDLAAIDRIVPPPEAP